MPNDEWSTPQWLFDELNEVYHFTLDPCATHENTKCNTYFTMEENGLLESWDGHSVFMNPPYSRGNLDRWIGKACEVRNGIVVCLLPACTGPKWFHKYIYDSNLWEFRLPVRFLPGRLKFGGHQNSARFDSMLVLINNAGSEVPF